MFLSPQARRICSRPATPAPTPPAPSGPWTPSWTPRTTSWAASSRRSAPCSPTPTFTWGATRWTSDVGETRVFNGQLKRLDGNSSFLKNGYFQAWKSPWKKPYLKVLENSWTFVMFIYSLIKHLRTHSFNQSIVSFKVFTLRFHIFFGHGNLV